MLRRLKLLTRSLLGKKAMDRELDTEIAFHLEMETQKNIQRGMNPESARWAALRDFGGVEQVKERCRDQRGVGFLETLLRDLRIGSRMLLRRPGFTILALLVLGLGIGANTAIFSVVRGVLLRPLPYANADRIVVLRQQQPLAGVQNMGFSPTEIADYRAQSQSLEAIVEYHSMTFTLLGRAEPQRVQTGVVSAQFFDVLGVRPWLGRTFRTGEDAHGTDAVLVLSHSYWKRAFEGDPQVIGKSVEMNNRAHTIIGVLPPLPQYPEENDVYMPTSHCPFRSRQQVETNRQARMLQAIALLKRGVGLQQAKAELNFVAARLQTQYPDIYPKQDGYQVDSTLLAEELSRAFRPTLWLLLGTAAFVLLIACANVANLTLARISARERELAIRAALGAGRGRLVRQLLTESTLLALTGGIFGLLLAFWGLDLLVPFAARFSARAEEIRIDGAVLLFTLVLSTGTGLLFGALPALSRRSLSASLQDGGDRTTSGPFRQRSRSLLLVAQLAFSFVLLIGAGLMVRSLINLHHVDPGFDPQNVLTMRIDLNWSKYTTPDQRQAFFQSVLEQTAAVPGVASVAVSAAVPLSDTFRFTQNFQIEGRSTQQGAPSLQADFRVASEDYFRTLGTPLLRGRSFVASETLNTPGVVILNESTSRHRFPDQDPVGQRISLDSGATWLTIVGVVGDVRQYGLNTEAGDEIYLAFRQNPGLSMALLLRSSGDPRALAGQVRTILRKLDPQQPIAAVQTLEEARDNSISAPRSVATLLALFAGLALVITAVGLGSVLALQVSRRTQEFAVRMALGATRLQVLRTTLNSVMPPVLIGLALGMTAAFLLCRVMEGLLFGIEPTDPLTFVVVSAVLLLAAAVAGLIPARRAASVEPMIALRSS